MNAWPKSYPEDTLVSKTQRITNPGSGVCMRCGTPWRLKETHSTDYGGGRACFPLCEECWSLLSPEERLPFYVHLMCVWSSTGLISIDEIQSIIKAVLEGK